MELSIIIAFIINEYYNIYKWRKMYGTAVKFK